MTTRPTFGAGIVTKTLDREIKQARAIFILLGLANIVVAVLAWNTLSDQLAEAERQRFISHTDVPDAVKIGVYIGVGIGVGYLVCGALVFKYPIPTSIVALVLYGVLTLIQLIADPSTVLSLFGIGLRSAMIIALVSAMRFAFVYERNRAAAQTTTALG